MWIERLINKQTKTEMDTEIPYIYKIMSDKELAQSIKQELLKRLGEKKESSHFEDGECGCKYLEDLYPCQIECESYNTCYDKIIKILEEGEI